MDSVSTADTGRSYIGTPHDSSMTGSPRAMIIDAVLAAGLTSQATAEASRIQPLPVLKSDRQNQKWRTATGSQEGSAGR